MLSRFRYLNHFPGFLSVDGLTIFVANFQSYLFAHVWLSVYISITPTTNQSINCPLFLHLYVPLSPCVSICLFFILRAYLPWIFLLHALTWIKKRVKNMINSKLLTRFPDRRCPQGSLQRTLHMHKHYTSMCSRRHCTLPIHMFTQTLLLININRSHAMRACYINLNINQKKLLKTACQTSVSKIAFKKPILDSTSQKISRKSWR